MLILIYGRVSTEEQARSGFSLAEQLRLCRERAALLAGAAGEAPRILPFTDDSSGEVLERPGLQAALALLRQERAGYFVCLDPDRLARRLMHQLLITDAIERTGCRLEFVQHDYQSTAEGILFYQLRGAIAEFEKAKILERTARGRRGKIAAGGLPYAIRMFGYRFVAGAGRQAPAQAALVPEPHESGWVRQIYRWCALDGLGPAAIATRLNALGVPTKTGRGRWRHTQVRRILRHPAYATGRLALGRQDHRGIAVARRLPREQRLRAKIRLTPRLRDPTHWQFVQIKPLVAPDLWHQAQERLNGQGRAPVAPDGQRPLAGLGRCGLCGGALHYLGGRMIACSARYRRSGAAESGRGCSLPSKSREAVEEAVWRQIRGWLLDPEAVREAQQLLAESVRTEPPDETGETAALQAELARQIAEAERLGLLYTRGLWPADKALPALEAANRRIRSIQSLLTRQRAEDPPEPPPAGRPRIGDLSGQGLIDEMERTLERLPAGRRTELIRAALACYELHPSGRGEPPRVTAYAHCQHERRQPAPSATRAPT